MLTETARAKINLTLHVGRAIDKPGDPHHGYHPLSSLVVFADIGDALTCAAATETSLSISGPFANALETDESNLVLRAYQAVNAKGRLPALHFHLTKNLPVASGIGGGSADAAAALRLLKNYANLPDNKWHEIAKSLGADVPVCLQSETCVMTGVGERIGARPGLKPVSAVLVNPGLEVKTAKVFGLFDQETHPKKPRSQLGKGPLLARAQFGRNDLAKAAIEIEPTIQICLDALQTSKGCAHVKMSGSGATCYGLFEDAAAAQYAAKDIAGANPNWWVQPVMLGDLS